MNSALPPGHVAALQRCEAATPGPWPMPEELAIKANGKPDYYDDRRPVDHEGCDVWPWERREDMAFAYRARTDLPTALAHLQRMVEALPDPARLRLLAEWIDVKYPDDPNPEVQRDLRNWADKIDVALAEWRRWGEPEGGEDA